MIEHSSQHEEREMAELLKKSLKPASPSPEFRERVRQSLSKEAQEQANKPQPFWRSPWIWAPAAAAALGLILAFLVVPLFSVATGTMVIQIKDAQRERDIEELNIVVTKVEVHLAGDTEDEDGEWITVVDGSYDFELLSLEGVPATVGSSEVPVGKYTQIRIEVEEDGTAVVDEQDLPLMVPSNEIKIVNQPEFDVVEDGTTVVTLDFDLSEDGTIVDQGDKIILKPTIKIEVTQED